MNILFITEDHSTTNYGITTIVSQLADQLIESYTDLSLTIFTTRAKSVMQNPSISIVEVVPTKWFRFWSWSPGLRTKLLQTIREKKIDLIHIHGIWMAVQVYALQIAKELHIPCIVSPHGMLESWLWNQQSRLGQTKKKLYFNLVLKPALNPDVVFHAITPKELDNLVAQLPEQSLETIPNAISVSESKKKNNCSKKTKDFLFLGRLHPVKAIDLLIQAFFDAHLPDAWQLVIAGPEYVPEYTAKLKTMVAFLGMEKNIQFIGPIQGTEKQKYLENSWCMVIPSYSEVIGMVNLEAAVSELPSITTYETGLYDWDEGGGILIHPNTIELTTALKQAAAWTQDERKKRGRKSLELVYAKYSWQVVLPIWRKFYSDLITNKESSSDPRNEMR